MKIRWITFALGLVFAATVSAQKASVQAPLSPINAEYSYVPGEVLVKFRPGTLLQATGANVAIGAREIKTIPLIDVMHMKLPANMSVSQAIQYYRNLPAVEYVEPNYVGEWTLTPNDPLFNQQYAPQIMQCPAAWDIGIGSPNVIVAIIDSGCRPNHPDLQSKYVGGLDMTQTPPGPNFGDLNGHGTHVAGISGAVTNNGFGVAGIGFNVGIMPLKVGDAGPQSAAVIASLVHVANNAGSGVRVAQMSLTIPQSAALENAVNACWNNNVIVVCAAGNSNSQSPSFPAFYENVIAVGSTDSQDRRSPFSNFGNWVDVGAPGSNILSTYTNPDFDILSGTSMAAPQVSGLAGLLWAFSGLNTSNVDIRKWIESTTDPVVGSNPFVNGRVNALKALQAATPPTIPVTVHANKVTKIFGGNTSGGLNQLKHIDKKYYWIETALIQGVALRSSAEVEFKLPNRDKVAGATLSTTANAAYTKANAIANLVTYVWNFTTQSWDQVDNFVLPTSDTTRTFRLPSNGQHHVGHDGTVKVHYMTNYPARLSVNGSKIRTRFDQSIVKADYVQ